MSRSRLSLFAVDRPALVAFSTRLRAALCDDDRDALIGLLGVVGPDADRVRAADRAVDLFLASDASDAAAPVLDGLRRAAARAALTLEWTSEALSLEGRLRGYEPLREDDELASLVDRMLGSAAVPWFLGKKGATAGVLSGAERRALASGLGRLDDLPPELDSFAQALDRSDAEVLCHDALAPEPGGSGAGGPR